MSKLLVNFILILYEARSIHIFGVYIQFQTLLFVILIIVKLIIIYNYNTHTDILNTYFILDGIY